MTSTIEIEVKNLDFYYNGDVHALKGIYCRFIKTTPRAHRSIRLQTTLLWCFNRKA
jgi:hypothetical protein